MAKSDYLRKSEVLNNGLYDAFRYVRQTLNSEYFHYEIEEKNPYRTTEEAIAFDTWQRNNNLENWEECERLYHAKTQRATRLKKAITFMLNQGECCFVTLTFSDAVLSKTTAKTRHDYVNRWLKNNFLTAIANIDFGEKNGREHYHAVVLAKSVNHNTWKYGLLKSKKIVRSDVGNADKLAHYTSKLVNHAIKETTKGARTIYSGYFGPKDHVKIARKKKLLSATPLTLCEFGNPDKDGCIVLTEEQIALADELFRL